MTAADVEAVVNRKQQIVAGLRAKARAAEPEPEIDVVAPASGQGASTVSALEALVAEAGERAKLAAEKQESNLAEDLKPIITEARDFLSAFAKLRVAERPL